jgi:hypothetical protein
MKRHFDMQGFHARLDQERQSRGLSWVQLAKEINRPFVGTPSIPIHPSTLRDMLKKRSITSDVVLQALRWLEEAPELYLVPAWEGSMAEAMLPGAGIGQILRVDTRALHAALNAKRLQRGLSWIQVAKELTGFQPGMLTNLAAGPLSGFPRVMLLTQWLNLPLTKFVKARSR